MKYSVGDKFKMDGFAGVITEINGVEGLIEWESYVMKSGLVNSPPKSWVHLIRRHHIAPTNLLSDLQMHY